MGPRGSAWRSDVEHRVGDLQVGAAACDVEEIGAQAADQEVAGEDDADADEQCVQRGHRVVGDDAVVDDHREDRRGQREQVGQRRGERGACAVM